MCRSRDNVLCYSQINPPLLYCVFCFGHHESALWNTTRTPWHQKTCWYSLRCDFYMCIFFLHKRDRYICRKSTNDSHDNLKCVECWGGGGVLKFCFDMKRNVTSTCWGEWKQVYCFDDFHTSTNAFNSYIASQAFGSEVEGRIGRGKISHNYYRDVH